MTSVNGHGVAVERTGWRDEALSRRHRLWGDPCKAIDLDWVVIEYTLEEPVALIEYKRHTALEATNGRLLASPGMAVIRKMADACNIPGIVAVYWDGPWGFETYPLNSQAGIYVRAGQRFSERGWVSLMHRMRSVAVSVNLAVFSNEAPADWASRAAALSDKQMGAQRNGT